MEIIINIINKLDVNFVVLFLVILIGAVLLLIGNGIQKGDILIKQNTIIFLTGLFVIVSGISLTIYIIIKPTKMISEPQYINTWGWDHEVGKPVIHVENKHLKKDLLYFAVAHPHDGREWKDRNDYSSCLVFTKLPHVTSHEIFFTITNPQDYPYLGRIVFRLFEWNKDKKSLVTQLNHKVDLKSLVEQGAVQIYRTRSSNDYDLRKKSGLEMFLKSINDSEYRVFKNYVCNEQN